MLTQGGVVDRIEHLPEDEREEREHAPAPRPVLRSVACKVTACKAMGHGAAPDDDAAEAGEREDEALPRRREAPKREGRDLAGRRASGGAQEGRIEHRVFGARESEHGLLRWDACRRGCMHAKEFFGGAAPSAASRPSFRPSGGPCRPVRKETTTARGLGLPARRLERRSQMRAQDLRCGCGALGGWRVCASWGLC